MWVKRDEWFVLHRLDGDGDVVSFGGFISDFDDVWVVDGLGTW